MMFTLVFPNEFQTCQSVSIRGYKKRPKVSPCQSVLVYSFVVVWGESVSLIGTVFILCNHFNTQLILLVYLILCG